MTDRECAAWSAGGVEAAIRSLRFALNGEIRVSEDSALRVEFSTIRQALVDLEAAHAALVAAYMAPAA